MLLVMPILHGSTSWLGGQPLFAFSRDQRCFGDYCSVSKGKCYMCRSLVCLWLIGKGTPGFLAMSEFRAVDSGGCHSWDLPWWSFYKNS